MSGIAGKKTQFEAVGKLHADSQTVADLDIHDIDFCKESRIRYRLPLSLPPRIQRIDQFADTSYVVTNNTGNDNASGDDVDVDDEDENNLMRFLFSEQPDGDDDDDDEMDLVPVAMLE
jgi:hypothetical protein